MLRQGEVSLAGLDPRRGSERQASDLLVDQLRAIDNRRLVRGPLTRLSPALMTKVGGAMREVLELVEE
jgi:mRNA interferase MazF